LITIRKTGMNEYLDHINISYLNILVSILAVSLFVGVVFGSVQYYHEKYLTRFFLE